MGKQMISPAECPGSSPSNKPSWAKDTNGLSIQGQSLPKRDGGDNPKTIDRCNVPDFGSDLEIK